MTPILLMAGFFITMLFFLIDKNFLPVTSIARKHIANRLERNKARNLRLQNEFENLVNSYGAWSFNAFPYNDVTYREYIALLKEKSNIEYADAEFEKINSKLKRQQIYEYLEKINNQEEAVIAFQKDLARQKKNLQSLSIASVS